MPTNDAFRHKVYQLLNFPQTSKLVDEIHVVIYSAYRLKLDKIISTSF